MLWLVYALELWKGDNRAIDNREYNEDLRYIAYCVGTRTMKFCATKWLFPDAIVSAVSSSPPYFNIDCPQSIVLPCSWEQQRRGEGAGNDRK